MTGSQQATRKAAGFVMHERPQIGGASLTQQACRLSADTGLTPGKRHRTDEVVLDLDRRQVPPFDPDAGRSFRNAVIGLDDHSVAQRDQRRISTGRFAESGQRRCVVAHQSKGRRQSITEFRLQPGRRFSDVADAQLARIDGNVDPGDARWHEIVGVARLDQCLQRGMGSMAAGMEYVLHAFEDEGLAEAIEGLGLRLAGMDFGKSLRRFEAAGASVQAKIKPVDYIRVLPGREAARTGIFRAFLVHLAADASGFAVGLGDGCAPDLVRGKVQQVAVQLDVHTVPVELRHRRPPIHTARVITAINL